MIIADVLNGETDIVDGKASLASDSIREVFFKWLSAGNAKQFSPSVCMACLDRISKYVRKKRQMRYIRHNGNS